MGKFGKVLIVGREEHAEVQAVRRALEEAGASPAFVPPSDAAPEMAGPDDLWVFEDHESVMLIPWLIAADGLPPARSAFCKWVFPDAHPSCPVQTSTGGGIAGGRDAVERIEAAGHGTAGQDEGRSGAGRYDERRSEGGLERTPTVEAGILLLKMGRSAWDASFLAAISARYPPAEAVGGDSMDRLKEAVAQQMTPGCRALLLLDLGLWPEKRRDIRFLLAVEKPRNN